MNKTEMFDRLVENGLDFLSIAVSEIREKPKYSVIHFHAAVELFLKARLMAEHWSLIVSKRHDPDWTKFVKGDFQSVSLDEAANRLDKVVRSGISESDLKTFSELAKHRNKMVHFFHEAHSAEEGDGLIRRIVKQQLKAWYSLHQLLTVQWEESFSSWQGDIAEVDQKLRALHEFLQVVFDSLSEDIHARRDNGSLFTDCPSCGFEAQEHSNEMKEVYEAKCLVCDFSDTCLMIECMECGSPVLFRNDGFQTCEGCHKRIEPEMLADVLIDEGGAHIAAKEGCLMDYVGNCSDCDGYHTVVLTEHERWVCSSCLGQFDALETCGWCNEQNTGDMEHSYYSGCNHCDGQAGHMKDD